MREPITRLTATATATRSGPFLSLPATYSVTRAPCIACSGGANCLPFDLVATGASSNPTSTDGWPRRERTLLTEQDCHTWLRRHGLCAIALGHPPGFAIINPGGNAWDVIKPSLAHDTTLQGAIEKYEADHREG